MKAFALFVGRDVPACCFYPQVKVLDNDITFALKVIKKKHVVDNRQEEHIHSERRILADARSPFIVKSVSLLGVIYIFHPTQWSLAPLVQKNKDLFFMRSELS